MYAANVYVMYAANMWVMFVRLEYLVMIGVHNLCVVARCVWNIVHRWNVVHIKWCICCRLWYNLVGVLFEICHVRCKCVCNVRCKYDVCTFRLFYASRAALSSSGVCRIACASTAQFGAPQIKALNQNLVPSRNAIGVCTIVRLPHVIMFVVDECR